MIKTIVEFSTKFKEPIIAVEVGARTGEHAIVMTELLPIKKIISS